MTMITPSYLGETIEYSSLHACRSTLEDPKSASLGYWKTLDQDYHWHIEILPILAAKAKSYTFKEVYYSPVSPESAAKRLREAPIEI